MNDYYVYIYWRLDTNEPFYVGKGKGNRWKNIGDTRRNKHFLNIVNKAPTFVEIFKDNLTEEQAHGIECWLINELVFKYGFSIDIPNNRSIEKGNHLVNCTWGGEGTSGINPYENKTEEELNLIKKKISEGNKGRFIGELNPMYGKNPLDYMTEEAKEKRAKKISEANKGHKVTDEQIIKLVKYNKEREWTEELKEKISKANSGFNNGNAVSVICLTTKRIFLTITEASKYYKCDGSRIFKCCKGFCYKNGKVEKVKSCGKLSNGVKLTWKFLTWKHNKRYRIKSIK